MVNANLDQALGRALFHNAGEGAGVREAVAFELVVEVGVGIEMDDGQPRNALAEGANDRQSDGVIAAQAHRAEAMIEKFTDLQFDRGEGLLKRKFQIAGIAVDAGLGEIDSRFGRGI